MPPPVWMAHHWAYEMVLVTQGLQVHWRSQPSLHETYKAGVLNSAFEPLGELVEKHQRPGLIPHPNL